MMIARIYALVFLVVNLVVTGFGGGMKAYCYALSFLTLNLVAVGYMWLFTESGEFHNRLGDAFFWLSAFMATLSIYTLVIYGAIL